MARMLLKTFSRNRWERPGCCAQHDRQWAPGMKHHARHIARRREQRAAAGEIARERPYDDSSTESQRPEAS
jgi:hypothetical protein